MKELILVRHGKSSWDHAVGDRDRPLLEKGVKDAGRVAAAFMRKAPSIDHVFSSPANRALHTCMIVLRTLEYPLERLRVTDRLYDFSGENVMSFVRGLEASLETVLIFGHNNAFTEVANQWGSREIENVPTAGLVSLKFDIPRWDAIEKGTTVLTLFPKQLR